jgi:hypothetical protein
MTKPGSLAGLFVRFRTVRENLTQMNPRSAYSAQCDRTAGWHPRLAVVLPLSQSGLMAALFLFGLPLGFAPTFIAERTSRCSPLRFGISFNGVGGPLNAARSMSCRRSCVS